MMRLACVGLVLAGLTAAGAARAADDPAFGLWLSENGRAIIEIAPCADKACGKIVWMKEPLNAEGKPKIDKNNSDSALASRPICGLPLVGDFVKGAPGEWNDGYIYDPESGDTYTAFMIAQPDGTLKVRGYVGISIIGKSQIWTRQPDNRGGC